MPLLKILSESRHITVDSDNFIDPADQFVVDLVSAFRTLREGISSISGIKITRSPINPLIFDYELNTILPSRVYRQIWHFDSPETTIEFGECDGQWIVGELLGNIDFRATIRELNASVGIKKLTITIQ